MDLFTRVVNGFKKAEGWCRQVQYLAAKIFLATVPRMHFSTSCNYSFPSFIIFTYKHTEYVTSVQLCNSLWEHQQNVSDRLSEFWPLKREWVAEKFVALCGQVFFWEILFYCLISVNNIFTTVTNLYKISEIFFFLSSLLSCNECFEGA